MGEEKGIGSHFRYTSPEADGCTQSAVFGIELDRVGDIQIADRCLMAWNTTRKTDVTNRLGVLVAKDKITFHPVGAETGDEAPERFDILGKKIMV